MEVGAEQARVEVQRRDFRRVRRIGVFVRHDRADIARGRRRQALEARAAADLVGDRHVDAFARGLIVHLRRRAGTEDDPAGVVTEESAITIGRQVRQQVASALTASATWDLPPDLLKRQSQRELERSVLELRRSGFDDDSIRRHVNELRQTVMASTARSLKEHFILERIAEDESITDASADYDEEIRAIAAQSGESPRRVRASLEKRGLMDVLRNQIIERKTLDRITSDAKFTDTPFEFEKSETDAVDHAVCGTVVGEEEIPTATHSESRDLRSVSRRG